MKLVRASTDPIKFSDVHKVHSWGEQGLLFAHVDGTVSAVNEKHELSWIWLNPGKRVSDISVVGTSIHISYSDQTYRVVSLLTGLETYSAQFAEEITNIASFDQFLVGWNKHSVTLYFINHCNFQVFKTLTADSFVVQLVNLPRGIIVVCTSDIYLLHNRTDENKFTLKKLKHFGDFIVIGATQYSGKLCLVTPNSWKVMITSKTRGLVDDMTLNAPMGTMFTGVKSLEGYTVLTCSDRKFMVLGLNNIQVLDPPAPANVRCLGLTSNSYLVTSSAELYLLTTTGNEFRWRYVRRAFDLTDQKWLFGETDPRVSASCGIWKGMEDGSINGVPVFPSPVLLINNDCAISRHGRVRLPLQRVNIIESVTKRTFDQRVSIQLTNLDVYNGADKFVGIKYSDDYITLYPFKPTSIICPISVLLVLHGCCAFDEIFDKTDLSPVGVRALEDLAVIAQDNKDPELLRVTAQFLHKAWTTHHVDALFRCADSRSLKVLASLSNYMNIDSQALTEIVRSKLSTKSVAECEAILWIFEQQHDAVESLPIPFQLFEYVSMDTMQKFASVMVAHSSKKFLEDLSHVLVSPDPNNKSTVPLESLAANLLLCSINVGGPDLFPTNETHLLKVVEIVIPAVHRRVRGAKDILVNLIASHRLLYHKEKQYLLVPTPLQDNISGIVFDMSNSGCDQLKLSRPGKINICNMNFSGDGKRVIGVSSRTKFSWSLSRGFMGFFGAAECIVDAVEFR